MSSPGRGKAINSLDTETNRSKIDQRYIQETKYLHRNYHWNRYKYRSSDEQNLEYVVEDFLEMLSDHAVKSTFVGQADSDFIHTFVI